MRFAFQQNAVYGQDAIALLDAAISLSQTTINNLMNLYPERERKQNLEL